MRLYRFHRAAIICLLLLFASPRSMAAAALNLVRNGDFSQVANSAPAGWEAAGDANSVDQRLDVVRENGNPCARLTCTRFQGEGGAAHAMIAQVGVVKLEQGKTYEFSCRARSESIAGHSVSVAISDTNGWENCGLQGSLALDRRWREFRFVFRATRSVESSSRLQFWFTETGTLFLDDVRIVEITAQPIEFTQVVPPAGGKNLVPNGAFAVGASGWSSLGIPAGWGNLSHLHGDTIAGGAPPHRAFLRIPLGGGRTPVLYFDYLRPVAQPQTRPLAANLGWIPVEKGAPYTLSCDMRASDDGVLATLGIAGADPTEGGRANETLRQKIRLSHAWQRFAFTFRPSKPYVFITVGPDLDRDQRVEVDVADVQLEKGGQATEFAPRTPVEIGLEPIQPGGIFTQGEPAALLLRACNHTAAPAMLQLQFTVADFFDTPAKLPPVALDIPAESTAERRIPLPPDWRGFYRVRAACTAGGKTETRDLRLAIVPRRSSDDTVLGINHAFCDRDLIRLASAAGVTWYRDWSLKWQDIEPSPGIFDWPVSDAQIDRVLKEGAKLMALLPPFSSAEWSSEAPPDLPVVGSLGGRLRQAWGPKDPAQLDAFVSEVVRRYRDRVRVWEFLNEPIYTDYALPGEGMRRFPGKHYTPADYVRLLKPAAAAMRASDPSCCVIGGVASGPGHLTRELMEAGLLDAIDLLNLHIYPGARAPEGYIAPMDALLKSMDDHGGRKPIWITEFSYYGADDLPRRPFVPRAGSWAEERLLRDERECAEYTVRFFTVVLARGVEKIFIHSGGSGAVNAPELECCLFGYGGAPRKVLPALAPLTELMGPHPRPILDRSLGEDAHVAAFETGTRSVIVLWSPSADDVRVPRPPGAVKCLDLMGRDLPTGELHLSTAPIYLIAPPGKAAEIGQALRVK